MESKVEWHKTSEELPEEKKLILLSYFNQSKKETKTPTIGKLVRINEYEKWRDLKKDWNYGLRKFNRWAYFPYPTK